MRVLIVGDIHGNLEALQAVLEDAGSRGGFQRVWCLGDTVGYGPDPSACLRLLREQGLVAVAGNHDRVAAGLMGVEEFNPVAATAALWTAQQLNAAERAFLAGLPLIVEEPPFTLAHGSPRDPIWEYVLSPLVAGINFRHFTTPYCLVSHSHVPFVCQKLDVHCTFHDLPEGEAVSLRERRLIINPGGVGQPRDGDPRASYIIYDREANAITHYRVSYDIALTQRKIIDAGLPPFLAERLAVGR